VFVFAVHYNSLEWEDAFTVFGPESFTTLQRTVKEEVYILYIIQCTMHYRAHYFVMLQLYVAMILGANQYSNAQCNAVQRSRY
jgi:hypothetical protein